MNSNQIRIYQAPLQGFTDFTFRNAIASVFGGVDKFFIPYLSFAKGRELKKSVLKDNLPENNWAKPVVPQVLFSDKTELIELVKTLSDMGYQEINLNLGCPYPMVTNRGRGAAWLQKPTELNEVLNDLFSADFRCSFSVKMRAGMIDPRESAEIFTVLNRYPVSEVIFHPRTANQMYDDRANPEWFAEARNTVRHPLVYNGDLCSVNDLQTLKELFPGQMVFMIGRGLLMNPALAAILKGEILSSGIRKEKLMEFHEQVFKAYEARLDGGGHLLQKMNQFWFYFSFAFDNQHKAMKLVKKASNLAKYHAAVAENFNRYF